jgi:hypothetical protein
MKKPDFDLPFICHKLNAPARRFTTGGPVKTARERAYFGPENAGGAVFRPAERL